MAVDVWWRTRMASKIWRFGLAAISFAVALAVALPAAAASSCFVLAVMVSSLYGGKGPAILCADLSALSFDYLFLPPQHHFVVAPTSYVRFAAFLGAIVLAAGLIEAKRARGEIPPADRCPVPRHRRHSALCDCVHRRHGPNLFRKTPSLQLPFGWAASDLIEHPLTLVIPNFRLPEHLASAELTGRRKDGTEFPVEVSFGR
jgi:hypothetical protein